MRGTIMRRRWAALASSVFVCLLSVSSVACAGNSADTPCAAIAAIKKCGVLPPELFEWDYSASAAAATPQEAYAMSAHFTPCDMGNYAIKAPDQSVTWLLSGSNIGVAYLRATCRGAFRGDYAYRYLLVLVKGIYHRWYVDGIQQRWHCPPSEYDEYEKASPNRLEPSPADMFPADAYFAPGTWRNHLGVSAAARNWVALTPRDYVLGLAKDSVIRPPDAISTMVDGLPEWVTEANGMAAVVALRPYGVAFLFAGTGSASEIESLAARVLPKAEDVLGGSLPAPDPIMTPVPVGGA